MRWTVPDTAQSITFALRGDIDGLKDLFGRGLASPSDWALYSGMHQYKTVQFLISQGVHVDDESYEHVFDFGFRKKCSNTELAALECVRCSRGNDWIEEQHFPLLHQIIFGISPRSLAAVLKEHPDAVHAKDAKGRTALDWATARAQLSHMRLLIEHNSNVNAMDATGRSTILHAVDSHNVEAVHMLLEAGANPDPKVPEGLFRSSPLKAASFGGLEEMVKLLLRSGAGIDVYNPEGQTALHAAVITQNVEFHNSHAVLKLFVDRRYEHVTAAHVTGPQVLGVIAEHADVKTMSIIASSLLLKLSLNGGVDGFVAGCEILLERRDYDEKLSHAFEELLSSIAIAKEEAAASWTADGDVRPGLLHHLSADSSFCEEL
ncbi:ankyrin [Staphylotrichum tortipilum]|uniref:Ankyrin n=1 Tax=Staphylotrichum tortipilum TaxID=2831512 RepID=A0AAN6RP68_9PEZI|nr:ankyrin [Staphylotrichum longicolle]